MRGTSDTGRSLLFNTEEKSICVITDLKIKSSLLRRAGENDLHEVGNAARGQESVAASIQ